MSALSRVYRGETAIDFVSISRKTLIVSAILALASIVTLAVRPLNKSIDFTGGVIVSVENNRNVAVEEVRAELRDVGFESARVQISGDGFVLVQTEALDPDGQDALVRAVSDAAGAQVNDANVSAVGPTFGAEVTRKAIEALVVFLIVVSLFIAWRFEWKMAAAALTALFHDLAIAGGIYAVVGFVVTPATIIAALTILGYSLYDTVVVFDKVRENVAEGSTKATYSQIINASMNQVLMRSINTSLTSLLPVGSLLVVGFLALGAETLREFALALFIGIAVGTYSSLFVASPLLAIWKEREPEWERRRLRALRLEAGLDIAPVEPEPVSMKIEVAAPKQAVARPPKQRRKRR